jgi:transcriptional regulator with XRE-family HTH domain
MTKLRKMFLKLRNRDYRLAFASARVAAAIGGQISSMRKRKDWTQEELADRAGMKRSRISLLESADYEGFSFTTLKRIAAAFDVAVIVQFVSFRDFLRWSDSFNAAALLPESFADSERAVQSEDFSAQLNQLVKPWKTNPQTAPVPPMLSGGTSAPKGLLN